MSIFVFERCKERYYFFSPKEYVTFLSINISVHYLFGRFLLNISVNKTVFTVFKKQKKITYYKL